MPVANAAAKNDTADVVPQNYKAAASVLPGMLVEPGAKGQGDSVVPAGNHDTDKVIGVVIPASAASVTLTPPAGSGASQQVLVAAAGRYGTLVSNQNGPIKAGDYLAMSAMAGIAMKAGSDQRQVVGRAVEGFDGKSGVIDTANLKSSLGRTTTAAIGRITVDVRLAANPLYKNTENNLPGFLSRAANSVANKSVNPVRVYLSAAVLVATFFVTGGMFYGGIRGGVTAIGRNPLAKREIIRGLIQAVVMGLVVFTAGILAVYVILV